MERKENAILTALCAFFGMALVQSLCRSLLMQTLGEKYTEAHRVLVLGISAVVILAIIAAVNRQMPISILEKGILRARAGLAPLACCLVLGLSACLTLSAGLSLLPLSEDLLAGYTQAVPLGKGASQWLELFILVLLVPVMEETLFRGVILSNLRRAMPLWAAAGIECLLFAWGHGQLLWFLYAFAMGAALTLLRLKTGSLRTSIVFHMAFNGANYLQPQLTAVTGEARGALWGIFLLGMLLCLLAAVILLKCCDRKKNK